MHTSKRLFGYSVDELSFDVQYNKVRTSEIICSFELFLASYAYLRYALPTVDPAAYRRHHTHHAHGSPVVQMNPPANQEPAVRTRPDFSSETPTVSNRRVPSLDPIAQHPTPPPRRARTRANTTRHAHPPPPERDTHMDMHNPPPHDTTPGHDTSRTNRACRFRGISCTATSSHWTSSV